MPTQSRGHGTQTHHFGVDGLVDGIRIQLAVRANCGAVAIGPGAKFGETIGPFRRISL